MIIESKPFAPGHCGDVVAVFSIRKKASGVYMTPETAQRFSIERIDKLTSSELAALATSGVLLVGVNGTARHGLRIGVRRLPSSDPAGVVFRGEVALEADTSAMEHELGFVVESGLRDAHDLAARRRRKGG